MRAVIVSIALALLTACAAPPPRKVEVEHGLVRAGTDDQARRVVEALEFTPQLREALGATRTDRPELWVVEHDLDGMIGICYERRIELDPEFVTYHVLHELVHWYLPGSEFDGVPHYVEEGLCDFVALEVLGWVELRARENQVIASLTIVLAQLESTTREWFELSTEERERLTRLGFEVVRRLGMARLRALVEADATPWDYIEAAGIEFGS